MIHTDKNVPTIVCDEVTIYAPSVFTLKTDGTL